MEITKICHPYGVKNNCVPICYNNDIPSGLKPWRVQVCCSTLAIDFGKDLKEGNAIGLLNDLAELLQCTGAIKEEMQKLFGSVEKERPSVIASFDYAGLQGQSG